MPVRRRYVFQLALLIFSPDLAERYLIAQHELNYNGCVTAAAKYSYRGYRLDKAILFPALHRVVEAHGALGVRLVGASTNYPAFQRLKLVDLMKAVHYSDQDGQCLQQILEMHLLRFFDTTTELPLWGLTVLTDNTAIFYWHHCIGDGISSLAFHRALLAALNTDNKIYEGKDLVDIRSTTSMIPPLATLISVRPSISQFCHEVFNLLAPVSWTSGGSAWTGNPVKESSCRTEVRILELSPAETTELVACCRKNKATLASTLHILGVSVLSQLLHADKNSTSSKLWDSISTYIPISLRPVVKTSPSAMCNHVSQYLSHHFLTPTFSWATASALTSTLHSVRVTDQALGKVGMLWFLFGNFKAFWKSKIGEKREAGFETSSVGQFYPPEDAHTGLEKWRIDRVVVAQSDCVTGAAIKLNICGNPLGGLAITVTWSLDSVEAALADAFVLRFKQMFAGNSQRE
jgi:hypothetical protein